MDLDKRKMGLIRHGGHEPTEIQPGCLIGFYFAAHWVPTARNFLSKLIAAYTAINSSSKKFEIIFVSFDRNEDTFEAFSQEMPWLIVPYKNETLRIGLAKKFQISDSFHLVITTPLWKVISQNAIEDVKCKAAQSFDFWESISSNVKSYEESPYCEKGHLMGFIDQTFKKRCAYCKSEIIKGWTCLECKMSTCTICQEFYSNSASDEEFKLQCLHSHQMRHASKMNEYYMSRFLNSKYTCRTCNQLPDGNGLHCFSCIFDMCFVCAKIAYEKKLKKRCEKGHEITWTHELCAKIQEKFGKCEFRCEICGESYMGGGGYACQACEYYVCIPCVRKT
ncbi:hypothetical protein SteCoe_33004 [Stentor coeruleus]|uniref:protein-disulfide reductase n=1 Tax=Stentor coeruleus TaxID=5963 RepID=A0A1R2AXS2_9CILI|nr:hypothetical protein SteCoe_33004 [Stentor coeruleus]